MHGILSLYMLHRKQLIQNVSTYVALRRSKLITKLKHCRKNIRKNDLLDIRKEEMNNGG